MDTLIHFFISSGYETAIRKLKEDKRERMKKRREFFKEQKEKKLARMKELDTQKLPDDFLASLPSTAAIKTPITGEKSNETRKSQSVKKVFNSDHEDSDQENTGGFIALETDRTDFRVMSNRDLARTGKNAEAFSFREKMLFNTKRLKRVTVQQQKSIELKQKINGRNGWV